MMMMIMILIIIKMMIIIMMIMIMTIIMLIIPQTFFAQIFFSSCGCWVLFSGVGGNSYRHKQYIEWCHREPRPSFTYQGMAFPLVDTQSVVVFLILDACVIIV